MFKLCVTHLKIPPSEAWNLDIVEIHHLLDNKESKDIDCSIMLNFERIKNGADKLWLQKN
jgi:hypothetical protein